MFNIHVQETTYQNEPVLYNTVTKKFLPLDSAKEELEKNYFLAGQENEAIKYRFNQVSDNMSFNVNLTWECTLRCTHCSVRSQLVPKEDKEFNVGKFLNFANRFVEKYNKKKINIAFIAGEALLRPHTIIDIIENFKHPFHTSTTTNLAYELTEERIKALSYIKKIVVSIDGLEKEHNEQRIPYKGAKFNPFQLTVQNLKVLLDRGLGKNIALQAALKDEYLNNKYISEYIRYFLKLGIRNISWGGIHTTDKILVPSKSHLSALKSTKIRYRACCQFRPGEILHFDNDENVWDGYWSWTRKPLGTFDSSPEEIITTHVKNILLEMPCLKDKTCLGCPALGVCWGQCINSITLFKNEPSRYCNQEGLIKNMKENAKNGKLVKLSILNA